MNQNPFIMEFIDRALAATACPNCGRAYAEMITGMPDEMLRPLFLFQTVCCQSIYCTACNPYAGEVNGAGRCHFCGQKCRTGESILLASNGGQMLHLVYRHRRYGLVC